MPISTQEYERRYSAVRAAMKTAGFDRLLVAGLSDDFNRGNIRYLTGSGRGGVCVFPISGKPVLLVNPNQTLSPKLPNTIEATALLDLRETAEPAKQAVAELERLDHGQKIGFVGINAIQVPVYLAVQAKFGAKLVDVNEFLRPLRDIKSAEEIEKLRSAAAVADRVYRRLREIVKPGLSEYAIYGEVKKVIYESGCEYSFDLLDAAGSHMNMAFFPTVDKLEANGTLFMEISPAFQGYYAQLPVTLPVGAYLPHVHKMVEAWHKSDERTRPFLKPGAKASDIYKMLVETIIQNGFISPLRPGHSVGLDILDFWSFTDSNPTVLKPGMVVAVHPCVMTKIGGDGVGLGYTYLITEKGAERFSQVDLASELL